MNIFDFCIGGALLCAISFGIVGNVLSFIVWTKGRRCKRLPGGIYLRALAVSDTIALCIPAANAAVGLLSGNYPDKMTSFFCKLESMGRHFGLLVSSWIVVCFTLERTIAIFHPHNSTDSITKRRTIYIVTLIFIVNCALNIPYGVVNDIYSTAGNAQHGHLHNMSTDTNTTPSLNNKAATEGYRQDCGCDPSSFFSLMNWYHTWLMDFVLIFIVPFTLISICNTAVLFVIVTRGKSLQSTHGSRAVGVTIRAVAVSVLHCLTTGPFAISLQVPGYLSRALTVKYSQEYYINKVILLLAFLNHAVNFILYSFFGSDFRGDCATLLCVKKSTSVHPYNSSKSVDKVRSIDDTKQATL